MKNKTIKLFGMIFEVDGNYLIGNSKDITKLKVYILTFVVILLIGTCLLLS